MEWIFHYIFPLRSAGLSIPGRDTDCMSCSVFICALRSLYSALKSIPLHYHTVPNVHSTKNVNCGTIIPKTILAKLFVFYFLVSNGIYKKEAPK